jgi:hypothetical protein
VSIETVSHIQVVCDRAPACDCTVWDDEGDPILFNPENVADALAAAREQGWTTDGSKHHCESCSKLFPLVDLNPPPEPIPVIEGQEVLV